MLLERRRGKEILKASTQSQGLTDTRELSLRWEGVENLVEHVRFVIFFFTPEDLVRQAVGYIVVGFRNEVDGRGHILGSLWGLKLCV